MALEIDKSGKPIAKGTSRTITAVGNPWWEAPESDMADAIGATLSFWAQNQRARTYGYHKNAAMYGNLPVPGYNASRFLTLRNNLKERITYNGVLSCNNTLASKIARNEPMPYWVTNDGDYKLQRKAKMLTLFNEGVFAECRTRQIARQVFLDACAWAGDGFLYAYPKNGRIAHERVLATEIWLDEVEATLAGPSQMHRVKNVDKSRLKALYPEHAEIIEDAKTLDVNENRTGMPTLSNLVTVRVSWRLPTMDVKTLEDDEESDGLYTVSVSSGILEKCEWRHNRFPFSRFQFQERPFSYFGQSLTEQLAGMQTEIDRICWVIQRSMIVCGTYKIWVPSGSGLVTEHINNQVGAILKSDQPPKWLLDAIVQPEIYQRLATLIQSMYEQSGISQLQANAKKPEGVNSGKAIDAYNDIGDERLADLGKKWADFHLDIAELNLMVLRDIIKDADTDSYVVRSPRRNSLETVDWKDIDIEDDDCFHLKCYPINEFSTDPSARWDRIQEMMQANIIDADTGRALLDFPDLDRVENLHNAQRELTMKNLDDMFNGGDYLAPTSFDNLQLCQRMSLEYIARGLKQGLPDKIIDTLRRYNRDAIKLLTPPQPSVTAPPASGATSGTMPPAPGATTGTLPVMAKPAMPPVNSMLPFPPKPGAPQQ